MNLSDIWEYHELLYFLIWRELKVRYKQTALGVAWVVVQPLVATLIFTVIFGNLARMPSNDLPYPVFALAGLLPWNYFAAALGRAGTSLVQNAHVITKVYFPRILIPMAGVISMLLDFCISFVVLLALMLFYQVNPAWTLLTMPLFLLLAIGCALGVSLWLAALNVQYRDVNHLLPFVIQAWMYITPIVYPVSLIPEQWRILYGLNPMASVVEGFRAAVTGQGGPTGEMLLTSTFIVMALLVSGLIFFRQTEQTFADIV